MTQADLLADTHKMLTTAIKEGWSEGKFVKNASEMFEKKGWTGKKEVTNPKTGEVETVELGTSRRIKTIFRCNMSSAYSVGRYKQQLEDADVAPYFQYCAVMDGRTRPAHQAMNGKIFRYDDPIWNTMYPPNGWNCRCTVVSLTPGMVKRKGLTVESSEGRLTETTETVGDTEKPNTSYRFDRNGLVYDLKPDAGWGTNLGTKAWNLDVLAYSKIKQLPQNVKDKFISDMASNIYNRKLISEMIQKTIQRGFSSRGEEMPITWFSPKIIYFLEKEKIRIKTPVVVFEDRQVKHSLSARKVLKQRLSQKQFLDIYSLIHGADELYLDTQDSAIVYVKYLPKQDIFDNRDCIKIPVKINSDNENRPVNYIGTTGRVNSLTIKKDKRFKRIE